MPKLYYCACRCGCTTVIFATDNQGCTYCMENHKPEQTGLKPQFNPFTEVKPT